MDLQLLGPVEATLDGRPIPLGATKQRALLAMLALEANAAVAVDRLVDGLWGEDPPATAAKMVQLYVSQLRRLLAGNGAEILTRGRGYELRVPAEAVDAARFERLVEQAGSANDHAREALALWHGPALADVADEPFAGVEIRRLEGLWLRAAELAVDRDLAGGRDQEALAQLERLIEEHPLRERLHAQRMLALYRSGRQADALDAYVAARRRLVDDIGVEPGAELRELHDRMLRQDPELRLAGPAGEQTGERGRVENASSAVRRPPAATAGRAPGRRFVVAAAAAILLGLGVFAFTRLTGPDRLPRIDGAAVGVIDADAGAIRAQYRLGFEPGAIAAGAGSVWVASRSAGTVSRLRQDGDGVPTIDAGRAPVALAFGAGSLWVADGDDGTVAQVDPSANRVEQRIAVGNGLSALAVGSGAVWAATTLDSRVVRIDLRSGRVTQRIAVGGRPVALAVGAEAVWVAAEESGSLVRIDPHSGDIVDAIRVGNGPAAVAVGLGAVWTANRQDGTVSRIDPASDRIDPVPAGREPVALTIANGALWVADAAGAVLRLDPRTRTIAGTVRTGSKPAELAAVDGAVWATTLAPATAHRGGTLRVATAPVEVDPELAGGDGVSFPVQWLAYDGLLTYRRAPGAAGTRLVGNLAIRAPEPTDGGLRYVFKLRPGLRYSDGTPVRASDFRASMERMLIVEPGYGSPLYEPIKGAVRCRKAPRACDLSRGIATDDRTGTITIRLNRPDPELRTKLTYPLAVVLPSTTPRRPVGSRPIPGTGPYRVERIGRSVLLARNPYFRPRDGRPAGFADRVAVTTRYGEKAAVAAVERGELDFSLVFRGPAAELSALRTRVGARLQSGSWAMTEYAFLNVRAAPFDDPRVRRALNLAVDRDRVVELTGGPDAGTPTCQLLPPGLPGYRPLCPFTIAPSPAGAWTAANLPEARRLVAASGRRGATVEVWTWSGRESTGRYLAHVLHDLGFRSRVRVFPYLDYGRMPPQIGVSGWFADSPEPGPLLRALVSCDAYRPGDPTATTNGSRFCDPAIDAAIDRAQAAGPAALDAWPRIERRIAAHAPVVPLLNRRGVAVLSRRAGNLQFSPLAGIFLEQLWVR